MRMEKKECGEKIEQKDSQVIGMREKGSEKRVSMTLIEV
jgi:hypothetical protein